MFWDLNPTLINMYMTQQKILLIREAFQNTEEWRFSFWNIFFGFRDIDVIRSVMMSLYCNWKNDISGNIKAVFLKFGTINVHDKRTKLHP